jgi:HAD superfamily hydrolase (TIGR01509 family)
MNNKAVIFDMDGVLIDSVALNWQAINQVLAAYKVRIDDDQIVHYLGKTLRDQLAQLNNTYRLTLSFNEFETALRKAKVSLFDSLKPKEGVIQLLDNLSEATIPFAVATSSTTLLAKERLATAGLLNYFKILITADQVEQHKPDPAVYLKTAKILKIDPAQCVVFEDAPAGVQAAKAANMTCIAVSSPFAKAEHLQSADIVISSLKEVTIPMIDKVLLK